MTFDELSAALLARTQGAVPSVGSSNVSLDAALSRFHAAEEALDKARELCRAAARREGKRTSSLFADAESTFITRATGEKWGEAVREEMRDEIKAAREEGLREGEARAVREQGAAAPTLAQKIVEAGEVRRGERPAPPDNIVRDLRGKVADPQATAAAIIAAGRKARTPRE
jgi:hypothetical protein